MNDKIDRRPDASLQGQPSTQGPTVAQFIESMKSQIGRALPAHITPDRMARVVLTAVRKVPDLAACSRDSLAACILDMSQLGLEPNSPLGLAYLIPRRSNQRGMECTAIIGYQGYLDLARRSGLVRSIYAHVVRKGDVFSYELGLDRRLQHQPIADSSAPMTHVYAVAKLTDPNADPLFVVLTRAEVEARRDRGAKGPAWRTDFDAMAMKSAVRALWPWLPKSAEMALASEVDQRADEDDDTIVVATPRKRAALLDAVGADIADTASKAATARATARTDHDPDTGEVLEPGANDEADEADTKGNA